MKLISILLVAGIAAQFVGCKAAGKRGTLGWRPRILVIRASQPGTGTRIQMLSFSATRSM